MKVILITHAESEKARPDTSAEARPLNAAIEPEFGKLTAPVLGFFGSKDRIRLTSFKSG